MNRLTLLLLSSVLILVSVHSEANAASVPDAPTGLVATAVSPTQVNLFWSAPSNDGQSSITGYKIEYRVGSGSYSILVANTASSSTTYAHTGLTTDQTYTYHVYAINSVGTSTSSSEISATPTSSSTGTDPGTPTNLSAIPASPTQVNLSWSAPSNTGGWPITGYKIEYHAGSDTYSILVANTGSASTTYSHTGLTTGQYYLYRVYAITSFGTGPHSSEAYAQPTSSSALAVPGIPTGVSAVPTSPTQINLSWTAPASNGGSPISGYKIEAKVGSGSYSVLVANTASTSTSYTHASLTTGTAYTYRVYAINSVGTGPVSSESSATPTSSSSATVPSAPQSLTSTSVSSTQNNLSWSAPSNNGGYQVTGYKIEYRVGSGSYSVLVSNTGSTLTAYSHTGLSGGQVYVYRVSAINYIGIGAPSAESSVTTSSSSSNTPGSPVGLTATAASPTQVNLSWSAPSNDGGSAVTGYKIEVKKGTESYETLVSNTQSTATSFSHTGLTKGSVYYYRVSAINAAGAGSSSEASATPKDTTAPALTATAVSPTSIALSWVPPSETYKQSITGYKIEERVGPDSYKIITDNTGSTATSYSVTGLTTGISHTYVVSAYFTLGASPNSNDATATPLTTSTPPPSQSNLNPPGSPTGLSAKSASTTQINLSWSAPSNTGGSVITGYKIEFKKGTGSYETLTSSTQNTTTKYSHTGLTAGTTYYYRIYAINSVGISPASSEASAVPSQVLADPPGAPILTVTHTTSSQASLHWSAPSNNGGATVTGYKIEYKIGSGSYMTLVNKATSTSYSHSGLLPNTYSYRVYAINSAGTGLPSNVVSVTVSPPVTQPDTTTDDTTPDDTTPPDTTQETPKTHIPGFPDPAREPQYYVDRYNNEPEFKTWFDNTFPGESIYDVVGAKDPNKKEVITTHIPGFPDPEKDSDYYIYLYNNEPSFKTWYDANFPTQTIYSLFSLPEPAPVPDASKCGAGTHLDGGICVLDAAKQGGGCLIATAAYGSEMSSQVQQLREIRDNVLMRTESGTAFMTGFNQFYYSFSPAVADLERQSPIFKQVVKMTIAPMLFTMSAMNHADSESEMLGYGAGIIVLNAGIYLGIPAFSILIVKNRSKIKNLMP